MDGLNKYLTVKEAAVFPGVDVKRRGQRRAGHGD
jgi:hypothetical protein